MKIIIDSNIVFSALLSKDNKSKLVLTSPKFQFYSCNFMFVELFKNKEKIRDNSQLSEEDILLQLEKVTSKINFVQEEIIPLEMFFEAFNLCKDVDENDTPFIALSIFLKGHLLTGDKKIYQKLKNSRFNVLLLKDLLKI